MQFLDGYDARVLLELLLEHTRDAVLVVRQADGQLLLANRAACDLYGYSLAELLALKIEELRCLEVPPAGSLVPAVGQVSKTVYEMEHRCRDGSTLVVETSREGGLLDGQAVLVCIVRDISERKRIEQEQQRTAEDLQRLLASTDQGLYGTDGQERCTFVNRAAAEMLGYRPEELVGRNMHQAIHARYRDNSPYPAESCPLFQALFSGSGTRVAGEVFWRKDGSSFPVEYSCYPVRSGEEIAGAVVAFQDISERERLEQEREVYLQAISHDLRQPLSAILGQAEVLPLLLEQQGGREQVLRGAELILRNSRLMNSMIQALLDIARLEAGQVQVNAVSLEPAAIRTLVERLVASVSGGERVELAIEPALPVLLADPLLLQRVLGNLLSNALKYSAPETMVTIRLRREGETVTLAISDRGSGISAADLPHIFERYYRSRQARAKPEGLGLGLYITRGLVEAMSGQIRAESVEGQGTTFWLSLPVAQA